MCSSKLRRIILAELVILITPRIGYTCSYEELLPCCNLTNRYWAAAKNRSSTIPEALLEMVVNAQGFDSSLGVTFNDLSATPVGSIPDETKFIVSMNVKRLFSIDQKAQNYKMKYTIKWHWRDCRALYSGRRVFSVEPTSPSYLKVFKPTYDINERLSEERDTTVSSFEIDGDGLMTFQEVRVSVFACAFDFKKMPFDEQECSLQITVAGGASDKVQATWDSIGNGGIKVTANLRPPEWTVSEESQWLATDYAPTPRRSSVRVNFQLTRQPWFSISNYIIPSTLYWLASWLGLWINPDAVPARAAFGVIPVLVMTNKMNSLASALPPISDATRLQTFLLASLIIISLQMLEYGAVHAALRVNNSLQNKTKRNKDPPPPLPLEESPPPPDMGIKPDSVGKETRILSLGSDNCPLDMDTATSEGRNRRLELVKKLGTSLDYHSRWFFAVLYCACTIFFLSV